MPQCCFGQAERSVSPRCTAEALYQDIDDHSYVWCAEHALPAGVDSDLVCDEPIDPAARTT